MMAGSVTICMYLCRNSTEALAKLLTTLEGFRVYKTYLLWGLTCVNSTCFGFGAPGKSCESSSVGCMEFRPGVTRPPNAHAPAHGRVSNLADSLGLCSNSDNPGV